MNSARNSSDLTPPSENGPKSSPLQPIACQINLHVKKIQLSVPSSLKVKLMWLRGSKKMETKQKVTIDPKSSSTTFTETMSLATKFYPDPANPTVYKRKRCYLQLMAMTKGQMKPVGILPFNLSDFLKISPNSMMKLTFAKCFDSKAAIFLTTSMQELDTNEHLETESNATLETISDTFSEYSSNQNVSRNKQSFVTSEGGTTTLSSYVEPEPKSAPCGCSEKTSQTEEELKTCQAQLEKQKELVQSKNNEIETLKNEVLSMDQKVNKLELSLSEKDQLIKSLRGEISQKEKEIDKVGEDEYTEKHKLKMKIEYLTNKCFQLSCKLDKKDFTPPENVEKDEAKMIMEILDKKQREYCDTEKNHLQDPCDFLFNIFAQYENMQERVRKLSETNDCLKQELVETKVKWAESEGKTHKLEIAVDSIKEKMNRSSLTSHGTSVDETSESGQNRLSLAKKYLPTFGFWSSKQPE